MFRYIIAAAAVAFAVPANAQVSCQTFGGMTTCSNGVTSQRYGNMEYYQQNGRSLGTRQDFGNMQFYTPGPQTYSAPQPYASPRNRGYDPYGYGNYGR